MQRQNITMKEYYAYILQQRFLDHNTILRGGRLLQQFIVDAFATVEETRLRYIRDHQTQMRTDMLKNIRDVMGKGDTNGSSIGKRVILPASFTTGPRYLFQNYQDIMAICRNYGYPTLFITFTCNSKWPEIQ